MTIECLVQSLAKDATSARLCLHVEMEVRPRPRPRRLPAPAAALSAPPRRAQTPETAGEEPVSSADKFAQMMAAKAAGGEQSDARRPVAFDVYITLSTTEGK